MRCENQFYPSIKLEELSIGNDESCPFGYFRLPKEGEDSFDCLEWY